MPSTKAAFVGVLGAAVFSLAIPGTAAATAVAEQGVAGSAAPLASLNCKTSVGNTGGWAECKGRGTWRVRSVCNNEPDKYTTWHSQRGGKQRVYAEQCTWEIDDVLVESR